MSEHSIALRLSFLYAVSAALMLCLAGAVLYWAVVSGLRRDDLHFLAQKIHVLRTMLREHPDNSALLDEEVQWETGVIGHSRYMVQIALPDGTPLSETRGFGDALPHERDFPAPIGLLQTVPTARDVRSTAGRHYLLAAAAAQAGAAPGRPRVVRLAVDVTNDDRILADIRRILIAVLVIGIGLSCAIGVSVARRGLRPLGQVAETIRSVGISRLSARLVPADWPQELRELVAAFNRLLERLEQAFGRISNLASELAHELRTPVNNLMGEAEVVLDRPRSADEYRQTIESSLEECQRLSHMIDTLLFLARAENPNAHLNFTRFAVRGELEAIVDYLDPLAQEKGLAVGCEGDALLWADRDLFRRAVTNLLSNAFRHTPAGGSVTARVSESAPGEVTVSISDTGPGIDGAEQAKVFERFYRGASARGNGDGVGLGLAIVRSIAELHGGSARLTSELGRGTTVTLSFPGGSARQMVRS